jgi:Dolichyl-phosphate-mannose-protein mannosyltransferase
MAAGGSPIVPHFNGVPYFEKPPLVYWLTAASLAVFGRASWAARLPITILGALGVAALFLLVDLWDDRRAAVYASICLATSFGYFLYARTLMMEIPLIALFIAAMLTFFMAYRNPRWMRPLMIATAALLGLAVLVKGLLGIAIPALALAIAAPLSKEIRQSLRRMPWASMAAALVAVAAPWHLIVELRHPGAMNHYLVEGQFLRYLSGGDQLDVAPLGVAGYLAAAALWFFPWVLFLPQAIAAAAREMRARTASPDRELVAGAVAWSVAALGFFAISPARIEYYSLPALIGMAILTGRWWSRAPSASRAARRSFGAMLAMGAAAWVVVLILVDAAGVRLPYLGAAFALLNEHYRNELGQAGAAANMPSAPQMLPLIVALAAALSVAATAGIVAMRRRMRPAAFAAVCAAALSWIFLVHRGLEIMEPFYSVGPLARRAALLARDTDRIAVMGAYENASPVSFYCRRQVIVVNGFGGDLRYGRSIDGSAAPYFIDHAALKRMWVDGRRVFLLIQNDGEDPPVPAPAYLLARDPAGRLFSNRP